MLNESDLYADVLISDNEDDDPSLSNNYADHNMTSFCLQNIADSDEQRCGAHININDDDDSKKDNDDLDSIEVNNLTFGFGGYESNGDDSSMEDHNLVSSNEFMTSNAEQFPMNVTYKSRSKISAHVLLNEQGMLLV